MLQEQILLSQATKTVFTSTKAMRQMLTSRKPVTAMRYGVYFSFMQIQKEVHSPPAKPEIITHWKRCSMTAEIQFRLNKMETHQRVLTQYGSNNSLEILQSG